MFSRKLRSAVWSFVWVAVGTASLCGSAGAQQRERLLIPVGRAEVVTSSEDVRTVAIAEPKIADAAVGSARTVVVNAKSPGITTLVVYTENARFKVYDVECFVPNGGKQVLLHVRVAEVNESAKREIGFDFYGNGTRANGDFFQGGLLTTKISPYENPGPPKLPGLTVGSATDGFFGFDRGDASLRLQAAWKALEEKGDLRTLANSTLMARSGEEATFLSGGEIPIPIASGSAGGNSTVSIEWKEFGVRLKFTPIVGEDNSITLKVAPEVSQIDFSNSLQLSGFAVPSLISRKASTTVNLNSGEHLVIGGLKQTEKVKIVRRIPILGQLPLLGYFFSSHRTETVEHDLLVVVSPEVVEAAASMPVLPTDRPQK